MNIAVGAALRISLAATVLAATALLAACGGSDKPEDQPPAATITSPPDGTLFRAGETFTFAGSATDPEDGALRSAALAWWADLHHDDHVHPFQLETAGANGIVTIPTRGETSDNIFYRFHLRATDSTGKVVEVTRDIRPRKAQITLATAPAGLRLTLDGQPVSGPMTFTGVVGTERDLGAAEQDAGGRRYRWSAWSQGGPASQTIYTPSANTTYTASFVDVGPANNQAPTVALTAPADATVGTAVTIGANASDSDGTVVRVDFFDGGTLVGSDTDAPFAIDWTPAGAGNRSLTARATDDSGAQTTSAAVSVVVTALNVAPTIALAAPPTATAGTSVTLTATATDGDGSVARVQFLENGTLIGTDTTAPYSIAWTPATVGSRTLTARATDDRGATTTSAAATVNVSAPANVPPAVSIGAPATATVGTPVAIAATAGDSDGSVASVQFLENGVPIGTDTTAPYGVTWTPATAGSRSLTAVATDNQGATTTSFAVAVTVSAPANLPPTASIGAPATATLGTPVTLTATATDGDGSIASVQFLENGIPIGTDTTAPYSVAWTPATAGSRSLTARATDNQGATTTSTAATVDVSPPGNVPPTVSIGAPATATTGTSVTLTATANDSDGSVASVQFLENGVPIGTDSTAPYGIAWIPAATGLRSLTARATDDRGATATSVAVTVNVSAPVNVPPTATIGAPSTATVGTPVAITATAGDSDGSVASVQFFENGTVIGVDTTAPYGVSWTPATVGGRSLVARATDNQGASTDSAAATVNVSAPATDTEAPSATLTAPANLASGLAGTITLAATAADNVGVAGVEFQVDGVAVGTEDTSAPYSVDLNTTLYASGQHVVRARARDAAGNRSAWATATVEFGGSRSTEAGFTRTEGWVGGLSSATAIAQAPDGRLFVAEQGGTLRVVKNGVLLATPFLSLSVDANGERGLIGVTVHPQFASNGWVYVYYTRNNGGGRNNRVSRFTASGDVSTGVETPLVDLPNLSGATNHNGGAMKFGSDGKLYVAVGDNADSGKPQNLADPFGKMLRFNDDGSIPADNPFCATAGNLNCAIWARGLRNPYTFAVQPGTGRMHINDVGQNTWEEINLGAAGANFGWPGSEGPDNVVGGVTGPLFTYRHGSTGGSGPGGFFIGCAITGGAFYPASGPYPAAYHGSYFFADYCFQWIGRLDLANGNAAYAFASVGGNPVDLLAGVDGALYVLTRGSITRIAAP